MSASRTWLKLRLCQFEMVNVDVDTSDQSIISEKAGKDVRDGACPSGLNHPVNARDKHHLLHLDAYMMACTNTHSEWSKVK